MIIGDRKNGAKLELMESNVNKDARAHNHYVKENQRIPFILAIPSKNEIRD